MNFNFKTLFYFILFICALNLVLPAATAYPQREEGYLFGYHRWCKTQADCAVGDVCVTGRCLWKVCDGYPTSIFVKITVPLQSLIKIIIPFLDFCMDCSLNRIANCDVVSEHCSAFVQNLIKDKQRNKVVITIDQMTRKHHDSLWEAQKSPWNWPWRLCSCSKYSFKSSFRHFSKKHLKFFSGKQ